MHHLLISRCGSRRHSSLFIVLVLLAASICYLNPRAPGNVFQFFIAARCCRYRADDNSARVTRLLYEERSGALISRLFWLHIIYVKQLTLNILNQSIASKTKEQCLKTSQRFRAQLSLTVYHINKKSEEFVFRFFIFTV